MAQENTEIHLIESAKKGDIEAFENLIQKNETMIYNITYRMMNHTEDAKDISQEVFLKAFRNIKKFNEKSNFSTWLYRIAINTCIDELRKQKNKSHISIEEKIHYLDSTLEKQFASEEQTPEDALLSHEQKTEINKAIHSLSTDHKTILILRDLEGFSYSEISKITKLSLGTVKSRLARAREQLRNTLLNQKGGNA